MYPPDIGLPVVVDVVAVPAGVYPVRVLVNAFPHDFPNPRELLFPGLGVLPLLRIQQRLLRVVARKTER